MGIFRYPGDIWTWRGSALVLGLTATPPTLMWCLDADVRSWSAAATASQLAIGALVLLASVALYVQYRVDGDRIFAWLSLGTALLGVQSLSLVALRLGGPTGFFERGALVELVDIVLVLLLLWLGRGRRRDHWPVDPMAAGLLAGVTLTVLHVRLLDLFPVLDLSGRWMLSIHAGAAVVGTALALRLARSQGLPSWATARLAAVVLLFAVNRAATCQPTETPVAGFVTVFTGIAATVVLLGVTVGCLRRTLHSQEERLVRVSDQLATAEVRLREQRARMHEITNSIAGIASASSLIHRRVDLAPPHRVRLERMLEREAARLARLLAKQKDVLPVGPLTVGSVPAPSVVPVRARSVVDLDDTLEPLVVAQEAVGHPVVWAPSGLRAVGDPDDVAEAVNILLDNARKHAPSAPTRLMVRAVDDTIEIVVSDDGPGIDPGVEGDLFDWGRRGRGSHGQGIGLHVAHRLLDDAGASLELARSDVGATFVITLPTPGRIAS